MDNKEEISKLNDEFVKAAMDFNTFVRENPGKDYMNYANNLKDISEKLSSLINNNTTINKE